MSISEQDLIARIQRETMPFVADPPYSAKFYDAAGRMMLMWGRLEQSLDDLLVAALYFSKKVEEYDIYTSLNRKLTTLKHIYINTNELKPLHGRAVAIAADVKMNADKRNPIMHASWTGFKDGDPPRITMTLLKIDKGSVTLTDFEPSLTDFTHMTANFHLCRAKILSLLFATSEIMKKAQAQGGGPTDRSPPSAQPPSQPPG
jgi:uncharacterized protein involved in high-affinity Fe2+ transport